MMVLLVLADALTSVSAELPPGFTAGWR